MSRVVHDRHPLSVANDTGVGRDLFAVSVQTDEGGRKITTDTEGSIRRLLEENERRHLAARRAATKASNARIRGVVDARDAGLTNGEISKALSAVREKDGAGPVRRGDVPHLLACGYPEDEAEEAAT